MTRHFVRRTRVKSGAFSAVVVRTSLLTWHRKRLGTNKAQVCDLGFYRGAKGNRTLDLFHAIHRLIVRGRS